jgi:hypothetical protein
MAASSGEEWTILRIHSFTEALNRTTRGLAMRSRPAVFLALSLLTLAATGCATITTPQANANLNVEIRIKDFQQGASQIIVRFADTRNNTVQFVSGETIACNDQFLRYDSGYVERLLGLGAYLGDVPRVPAGGAYKFAYTPARASATAPTPDPVAVSVNVVNAPVHIISPTSGSAVPIPKSAPLTIHYDPISLANTTILAVAVDSRAQVTFTLPQRESGAITMQPDQFNNFNPGPGQLSLVRVTTVSHGNAPFNKLTINYENISQFPVTWQ